MRGKAESKRAPESNGVSGRGRAGGRVLRTCALGGNEHREITLKRGDLVNLYLRQNKGVNDYKLKRDCNEIIFLSFLNSEEGFRSGRNMSQEATHDSDI